MISQQKPTFPAKKPVSETLLTIKTTIMKLLIIAFIFFTQQASANTIDTLPLKHRVYKTTILDYKNQSSFGYLSEIKDSVVMLSPAPITFNSIFSDNNNIRSFNYKDISTVSIRRTGSTGRGILIGALTGLATGIIAGFVEGDDPPEYWFAMTAGEKAIGYGALGSVAGAGIGAIIGAISKKKFTIGSKKEKFDEMRMNVLQRAYGKQSN